MQSFKIKIAYFQKHIISEWKQKNFDPEPKSEIFVDNIPQETESQQFIDFFTQFGEIFLIRIMLDQTLTLNRGFGYVQFLKRESALRALEAIPKLSFDDNYLQVKQSYNNCRIFISGVPIDKSRFEIWMELVSAGAEKLTEIILNRSYNDVDENRGFVYAEFATHYDASRFRSKFVDNLELFGKKVVVDWAIPLYEADEKTMAQVKKLYLINLPVFCKQVELQAVCERFIAEDKIQRVYTAKNYAFIHFFTRADTEFMLEKLTEFFASRNSKVEVKLANPGNKFTKPSYRQMIVSKHISRLSKSSGSGSSTSDPHEEQELEDEEEVFEEPNIDDILRLI